jgi:hypothetical protein
LRTLRIECFRNDNSSSAVALKSCFAIASIVIVVVDKKSLFLLFDVKRFVDEVLQIDNSVRPFRSTKLALNFTFSIFTNFNDFLRHLRSCFRVSWKNRF